MKNFKVINFFEILWIKPIKSYFRSGYCVNRLKYINVGLNISSYIIFIQP